MICFVFIATPLFMYEMIIGQYLALSALPAWVAIRPRWIGLGLSQFLMTFIVQSYYIMVVGYTIPYIVGSCEEPLPWLEDSETYWFSTILGMRGVSSGFQWKLVASYVLLATIIWASIAFGKDLLSKVTYVTVVAPVLLVVILVVRTAMLPGAGAGVLYYIGKFESSKLADLNVWARALSQCMFSLSPGFGTAITMSSYTRKTEDLYKTAIVVSTVNTMFAVIAGFAIFAMIGNIAQSEGEDVATVASRGGQGLAFIVIASAMPTFNEAANAMSVMFFVMLFTLGLDSAFAWAETLTATVEDLLLQRGIKRPTWQVSLVVCIGVFLVGLPYTTAKGNLILDVVDNFIGSNFLLYVCFFESVVIIFDFGYRRLEHALAEATGKRTLFPKYQCYFSFYFAIPVVCLGLFLYQVYSNITEGYLPGYPRIEVAGWILLAICLAVSLLGLWKCGKGTLPALDNTGRGPRRSVGGDGDNEEERGGFHGAGSSVELISCNDSHSHSVRASEA
mmetsp:Transcript_1166/g.3218  ORF Transcript_1166/g.3218 Transcript_1166/m.3218 type:complete len:505 (-) Transcript_1166:455-1969(-)